MRPRTCGRQFTGLRSAIHGPAVGNPRTPRPAADFGAEDSLCARVFLLQIRKFVFGRRMLFPGAAAPQNHASHGSRRKPGDNGGSYGWAASCGKGKRRPFQNAPSTIFANCQVRILPCSLSVFVVAKKRAILYNRKNGVVWVGGRSALPRGRLIPPLTRKGENA